MNIQTGGCYNKEVSLVTYIIGSVSSVYLILRKNKSYKIAGSFLLFVSQMQLIEYLIWNHDVKCDDFNYRVSNIGSLLNHFQPIVFYLFVRYFNRNNELKNKELLNVLASIYIICMITYSRDVYPLECVTLDKYNHLYWDWNYKKCYRIFYVIFVTILVLMNLYGIEKPYNILFALIFLGTYLLSLYKYSNTKAVGAIWCWYAALVPFVIMMYDIIV
jgi:hypothetical protein